MAKENTSRTSASFTMKVKGAEWASAHHTTSDFASAKLAISCAAHISKHAMYDKVRVDIQGELTPYYFQNGNPTNDHGTQQDLFQ